jgi:CBS domain-containing protein/anti-sigma regulatory factor (Ser/Thr protein kinase)
MHKDVSKTQEIFYELRVDEVMTREVITVTPQTSMRELQDMLREHRISGAPVVDDGRLTGIVSLMDLIQTLEARQIDELVSEHMTYDVETLYGDERVISAIAKFQQTGYGRFPVVDRDSGRLVGILTQGDIIKGTLVQLDIDYRRREAGYRHEPRFFQDILSEETRIILGYTIRSHDFVHGGEASSQFKRSLQNLGIHPSILRRVAVATYEAEMNLVLHATEGGTIHAKVRADSICIDVCDEGPGIPDVDLAMQPGYSTAPEWIREMGFGAGMGLVNIGQCADEMSLESEPGRGTHLRIVFHLTEGNGDHASGAHDRAAATERDR